MLRVDNKLALDLMKNLVFHGMSKHIDSRYHFIQEHVEKKNVVAKHTCTKDQRADILTKSLSRNKFEKMRHMLGVKKVVNAELGENVDLIKNMGQNYPRGIWKIVFLKVFELV